MLNEKMLELMRLFAEQATRVEGMVGKSVRVLLENNEGLAKEILETDEPLCNKTEIEIEARAIEILALYAPKAGNMRRIISIIKANKDLERMGDHAVNITENALFLIGRKQVKPFVDIPRMAEVAASMIRRSLDAFMQDKVELAYQVRKDDDLVDALNEQIIRELISYMASDPATIERCMKLIFIGRNLERIGDEATNLAEEFIYCLTGKDVRHPREMGVIEYEKNSNS
jgi:phosphate transport system protein